MQGTKQLLKIVICRLSMESFDIWFIPQGMGYGIQRAQIFLLPDILTQIGLVARMIGNQLLGLVIFLVGLGELVRSEERRVGKEC